MGGSLSYTLKPRIVIKEKIDGPGPGAYEPSHTAVFDKNPSWGLGSARAAKQPQDKVPGPGTYQHARALSDGPKWSIRGGTRGEKIRSEGPGPGQYKLVPMIGNLPYFLSSK